MIGSEVTRQCVIVPSVGHHQQPSQLQQQQEQNHQHQPHPQHHQHQQQYVELHELCAIVDNRIQDQNANNISHYHHDQHQQLQQPEGDDGDGWVGCDFGDSDCVAGGDCNCGGGQCYEMDDEDDEEALLEYHQDYHRVVGDNVVEEYGLSEGGIGNHGSAANIEEYMVVVGETYDGCPMEEEVLLP